MLYERHLEEGHTMYTADSKLPVKQERIKQLRARNGLSIAGLEARISTLFEQKRCRKKIGKSILQRIETDEDPKIPFWQISTIALAFDVAPDSIVDTQILNVREVDLYKVFEGSILSNMRSDVDGIRFRMDQEPGEIEAQDAVIRLLELLQSKSPKALVEATKFKFELRNIIDTLFNHNLALYVNKSHQVAPFDVGEYNRFTGENDVYFSIVNNPEVTPEIEDHFDGIGLCDVLLISLSGAEHDLVSTEHNMDPANLIHAHSEDVFLIENLARLAGGEEKISWSELETMADHEFVSERARLLENERRKQRKDDKT